MSGGVDGGSRCVALVGPYLSGKTSLLESLLHICGALPRKGGVREGNSVGDGSPEARAHEMSIELTVADAEYLGDHWSFIDCPGSIEFAQDSLNALAVCDAAVVVCEPELERAQSMEPLLRFLDDRGVPHMIFINKTDQMAVRARDYLEALQSYSRRPLLLRQVPIRNGEEISGYVDLISERAYTYEPGKPSALIQIPEDLADRERKARQDLLEQLADFDDGLMEQLLEDVVPDKSEIYTHLQRDLERDLVVPVLMGSALNDHGVRRLLKALRHDVPNVGATMARIGIEAPGDEPVLQVFKTHHQQHVGRLSIARVWRGAFKEGESLNGHRVGGAYRLFGHRTEKAVLTTSGGVVALGRMDESIQSGDFLAPSGAAVECVSEWPEPMPPVHAMAIEAEKRADEVKLTEAVHKLMDEDPSVHLEHPSEAGEMVLKGQGDLHLKVCLEKLSGRFNVPITGRTPATPYKETIGKPTEQHSRFKRQSGGHGQFADVKIDVKPRGRGEGFVFEDTIVGGAIPKQFIPAVENGVKEALTEGALGFPVVDIAVTLRDGQFHAVDSSDLAFKTAGRMAVNEALPKCGPILLEPILSVSIATPRAYTSKAQRVISGRRGQILGFDGKAGWDGWDEIQANIPQSEMQNLIVDLRSLSLGLATYEASFSHLQEFSGKLADKVVAARQEEKAS